MIPDLFNATRDYWRKLDALEAAYQRGDVSPEDVNATVQMLMHDLGQERRAALRGFIGQTRRLWHDQKDAIAATAFIGVLTYAWVVVK